MSPGSKGLIKGNFQTVMFDQTVWYFSNISGYPRSLAHVVLMRNYAKITHCTFTDLRVGLCNNGTVNKCRTSETDWTSQTD